MPVMNKIYYKVCLIVLFFSTSFSLFSQSVGINNSGALPAPSAILDVNSTTKGILIPRIVDQPTINAIVNPAIGLMVYNLASNCVEYNYTGTAAGWLNIACPCTVPPGPTGVISPAYPANTDVCLTTAGQTLTVPVDVGAIDYFWTVPSIVGTWSGQGGTTITVATYTAVGSGTFSVTADNNCGASSPPSTFTVNVFSGNPIATALAINPNTLNICGTSTYTVSITGLGNYDNINWSAPSSICSPGVVSAANAANGGNGATTLVLAGGTGGSGVVQATISNPCNSIAVATATINCSAAIPSGTLSQAFTNYCTTAGSDLVTYSAADYNTIVWSAPATICSPAVVTTANTANASTISLSGGTGGTGVVTCALTNYCGTTTLTTPTDTAFNGPPTATITAGYPTAMCTNANNTITLTGAANYNQIVWSAPATITNPVYVTSAKNTTSLTLRFGTGGTGVVSVTLYNTCGSITLTTSNITVSTFGNPGGALGAPNPGLTLCSTTAGSIAITGATNYTAINWGATSTNVTSAANIATAANNTTLTLSGGAGGNGQVSVTLTNACGGSRTLTSGTFSVTTGPPTGISLTAATNSPCSPDLVTINGLGNYTTIVWSVTGGTNICSAAVVAAANAANGGNGATSLTLSGGTGGVGTVTAVISNGCSSITLTTANITYTVPVITIEDGPHEIQNPATTIAIAGANANEIILISLSGGNGGGGGVGVKVDGNNATQLLNSSAGNANILLYGYVTNTVGPHNVVVTWGNMGNTYSIAQATSFKGFCGAPTLAGNVQTTTGNARTTVTSPNITPTTANSYLFGMYCIYTNAAAGIITWTNAAQLPGSPYHVNSGGRQYDYSFGGATDAAVAPINLRATDTQGGAANPDAVLIFSDINP